jgi:hypothetical protein
MNTVAPQLFTPVRSLFYTGVTRIARQRGPFAPTGIDGKGMHD